MLDTLCLAEQLARVDNWIAAHAAYFSPLSDEPAARRETRLKAFAELCLYLHVGQAGGARDPPSSIFDFALACINQGDFIRFLLASPTRTTRNAGCLLPFTGIGRLREVMRHYKLKCRPFDCELMPYQVLYHGYVCEAFGLYDSSIAQMECDAVKASALWRPFGCLTTRESPYLLAHSAFFASRFGLREIDLPSPDALSMLLDIEICKAFSQRNADAALELVLARASLFRRLTERDLIVLNSALALLERNGYVAPMISSAEPAFENVEAEWEKNYHTMIVLGLVLATISTHAAAISRGDEPLPDAFHLSEVALAMDAVGTVYAAIEAGNVSLAASICSKLGELSPESAPSKAMLEPALRFISSLNTICGSDP